LAAPEPSPFPVLVVNGAITPSDVQELCRRLRALVETSSAGVVLCDVSGLVDPDAATVEALARLRLTAIRLGGRMRLLHARRELRDLIGFMGLDDVVPCSEELPLEPGGQPEEREPPGGVEEEGDPRDLVP
jgi:ABC-type transporter Mla MlaB component